MTSLNISEFQTNSCSLLFFVSLTSASELMDIEYYLPRELETRCNEIACITFLESEFYLN